MKAARTLTMRLVERFGTALKTPFDDLRRLFPQAETIANVDPDAIGSLGIVRQRVGALQALARATSPWPRDRPTPGNPGAAMQ